MKNIKIKLILLFFLVVILVFSIIQLTTTQEELEKIHFQPYYSLSAKADIERRLGNYSNALTLYQKSLAINSKNPYPYQWMAYMYNEEGLFLPAISELNNALIYTEYYENDEIDTKNLNILESYINFRNGNNKKAQNILLDKVLNVNSIQRLSERYSEFNFSNESDRKYLPIYGDTYLILLYLKLNYTLNQDNESGNEEYKLNLRNDIEINPNIIKLMNSNYKEELIAYMVINSNLDKSNIYLRKYENILRNSDIDKDIYQSIINDPFIIHDFENY